MNLQHDTRSWGMSGILLIAAMIMIACAPPAPTPPASITIGVINYSLQLEPVLDSFKTGMTSLGYTNITYVYDGPDPDRHSLDMTAQELVALKPDLIVSISTPASQAAYQATLNTDIPVIFGPVTDPITANLLTDLVQPGGNLTGVRLGLESEEQRVQWLLKIVEDIQRIYVPYNSNDASALSSVAAAQLAADKLQVELVLVEARDADEITLAIENIPEDVQAIFLPQDSQVAARIDDFAAAAIARNLPLCTPTDGQVQRGALLSYSFKAVHLGDQMARLADQVLRQTPPGNIPIETAEFFLSLNLQTAKAIGITIPEEILRAAEDNIVR